MLPPTINAIPLKCINEAAIKYHIPAKLLIAILKVEGGKIGLAKHNKNGSYDLGPFQINTAWWPTLYHYGITPRQARYNPCMNVKIAAWILGRGITQGPNLLTGMGNYHSYRPTRNYPYAQQVQHSYNLIEQLLKD